MKKTNLEVGKTYEVRYPFVREEVELSYGPVTGWLPGVKVELDSPYDEPYETAEAHGEMLLTVVSIHKPGKFPERVFYTRAWRDPDGKAFGKRRLRITTTGAFRKLLKGYRHDYYCAGEKVSK